MKNPSEMFQIKSSAPKCINTSYYCYYYIISDCCFSHIKPEQDQFSINLKLWRSTLLVSFIFLTSSYQIWTFYTSAPVCLKSDLRFNVRAPSWVFGNPGFSGSFGFWLQGLYLLLFNSFPPVSELWSS